MTAEEYAFENMQGCDLNEIVNALEGFAKLKCQELLQIVSEKAKTKTIYESTGQLSSGFDDFEYTVVDKDSILNAVDLDEFMH